MQHKIWTVDAFANKPYTGNPSGVMIVDEFPNEAQDIAAAHILFQEKRIEGHHIYFDSLSGPLEVHQDPDGLVLDFPLQHTGHLLDKLPCTEALNLKDEDIEEVVQAHDDVIVCIKDEAVLRTLTPSFAKLARVEARGIIVTTADKDYDFVSRFFAPRVGVNEDPVTGSAHCKLADYWQKRLDKQSFRAYQASKRGGEIALKIVRDRVHLKGQAITTMEGIWKV